ncbi:MAG: 50S ribosomal protein L15 [Parcubacteria group bacterium]|nr:50S ribosomal protein L15 [Parcubacteria group bacterium]
MQLHELRPIHKRKKKKRVGRGGKRGTYAGRGMKGQGARAGGKFPPSIRELIKRYPKLRGTRAKILRTRKATLNVDVLESRFEPGTTVTPELLLERKIIRRMEGKTSGVKILGRGEMSKSFTIQGCEVSKSAKAKIEKAGGKIT